jgi:hypothetical protein
MTPEFILQPAAWSFAACREFFPQLVHFVLRLAVDEERKTVGKGELRPAVKRHILLPFKQERCRHDRPAARVHLAIALTLKTLNS